MTPKIAICAPLQPWHVSTIRKNLLNSNIFSTCLHNIMSFWLVMSEIDWWVWSTQQISNSFASWLRYCTNVARWTSTKHCMMFDHLLVWYPNGVLHGAKFILHPSLVFSYIGSVTARRWSSLHQPNFAVWYKEWNYGSIAHRHFPLRVPPIFRRWPLRWA